MGDDTRNNRLWSRRNRIASALLLVMAVGFVIRPINDVDIWWHIEIGHQIVKQRALPDLTTLYFTPVNANAHHDLRHTWLGDSIFYGLFSAGGDKFLTLFILLLTWIAVVKIAKPTARERSLAIVLSFMFLGCSYQQQIVRNAAFSLLGVALIIACTDNQRWAYKMKSWWMMTIIIVVWSNLHGSYLLGLFIMGALFCGTIWEQPDMLSNRKHTLNIPFAWIVALVFSSWGSHVAMSFLSFFTHGIGLWVAIIASLTFLFSLTIGSSIAIKTLNSPRLNWKSIMVAFFAGQVVWATYFITNSDHIARDPAGPVPLSQLNLLERLIHQFNSTLWDPSVNQFGSLDFQSPFFYLGDIYVWLSLGCAALAGWRLWKEEERNPLAFAWLGIWVIGLGYVRTIGYLGILSVFILGRNHWFCSRPAKIFRPLALFAFGTVIAANMGLPRLIGLYPGHRLSLTRAPYFSREVPDFILDKFLDQPAMNTIGIGGYLMLQWTGRKKVMIDGFFSPHAGETLDLHDRALSERNPDLFLKYNCHVAIIPVWNNGWTSVFHDHVSWYPIAVDRGMIVFQRFSPYESPPENVAIMLTDEEYRHLPEYLQLALANQVFRLPSDFVKRGQQAGAEKLVAENQELLTLMKITIDSKRQSLTN